MNIDMRNVYCIAHEEIARQIIIAVNPKTIDKFGIPIFISVLKKLINSKVENDVNAR